MAYHGHAPRANRQPSKYDYAATLAAALAYLMIKQGDKVGITLFDSRLRKYVPCGGTFRHLHRLVHSLEQTRPARQTGLGATLQSSLGLLGHRGLLVVISDFYSDVDELFAALNPYLHRGFEALLFQVLHPDELDLPDLAHIRLLDSETGESLACLPRDLRQAYKQQIDQFTGALERQCRSRRVDYRLVPTDTPYAKALEHYLRKRSARGR